MGDKWSPICFIPLHYYFVEIKMKIRVLYFTTFWNLHENTWWTSCNQFQHFKCHTEFENPGETDDLVLDCCLISSEQYFN